MCSHVCQKILSTLHEKLVHPGIGCPNEENLDHDSPISVKHERRKAMTGMRALFNVKILSTHFIP
jgi:hypothetical protein